MKKKQLNKKLSLQVKDLSALAEKNANQVKGGVTATCTPLAGIAAVSCGCTDVRPKTCACAQ